MVRTAGLLIVILAGLMYLYTSFQPRMRFADPSPDEPLEVKRNYPCYYDQIYGGTSASDVLFFGASKTHHVVDATIVEGAYEAVSGEPMQAFAFDTPESNPEIMYFFFRDYLAYNPSPKIALFSLTSIGPRRPPVRYMHPLFADLAPAYLYQDILRSWDLVNHKVFAISDFFRLLIRHLDLSLSRLLLADVRYVVPEGDNCQKDKLSAVSLIPDVGASPSFSHLLDAEAEKQLPPFKNEEVGMLDSLLETYAENQTIKNAIIRRHKDQARLSKRHFWFRGPKGTKRHRDYYRRIVSLGEANNVKVAFYFIPNISAREPRIKEVEKVAEALGAPVFVMPFWYTRISYHHYKDPAHVVPAFKTLYSIWFASLIDRLGEN